MLSRIIIILVLLFSFTIGYTQSCTPNYILNQTTTYAPIVPLATDVETASDNMDLNRAQPKINSIVSCGHITAGNWPDGTWFRGYETLISPTKWCSDTLRPSNCCVALSNERWSGHPLIRHTEIMGRGYMHIARRFSLNKYPVRMGDAVSYLKDHAQQSDGGFIWWYLRNSASTCETGENPTLSQNCTNAYATGRGLRTLEEGYWYYKMNGNANAEDYYAPIEHGANSMLRAGCAPAYYYTSTTTNFPGFGAWALAGAYKLTGNKQYWRRAKQLCDFMIAKQGTTGVFEGVFGALNNGNQKIYNGHTYYHDSRIWYHMITLRGLVEMLDATPNHMVAYKNTLRTAIARAVNHLINHRFDPVTHKFSLFYLDIFGNPIPILPSDDEWLDYGYDAIGSLAYYAVEDPGFNQCDEDNLQNVLNRMALGIDNAEFTYLNHIGMYYDYQQAAVNAQNGNSDPLDLDADVNEDLLVLFTNNSLIKSPSVVSIGTDPDLNTAGVAAVDLWVTGDFDGNGDDELLYTLTGSNDIYRSEDAVDIDPSHPDVTNITFDPNLQLDKWLVGDFDGNGDDEVLYQFTNGSGVYLSENGTNLGEPGHLIYTSGTVDDWLVGDFDGLGGEELLFKLTGSNSLYYSEDGSLTGAGIAYSGTASLERWTIGNFDVDMPYEILFKFTGSNGIYLSQNYTNLTPGSGGVATVYAATGPCQLTHWAVGDFDGDFDDEVIQKFGCSTKIYLSEDGTAFGTGAGVYPAYLVHLEDWIVGDFDGDGVDEVVQKFTGINRLYKSDSDPSTPLTLGNSWSWNLPFTNLNQWITGNFDGATSVFKSPPLAGQDENQEYLGQNFPNPFSSTTDIRYSIPEGGEVLIEVLDLQGRLLATLVSEWQEAGTYQVKWEGQSDRGAFLPAGMYLYQLDYKGHKTVKRMVYTP